MRSIALASLISATYACAASPGHTAQPFRPTPKGSKHILKAWKKDPFAYSNLELRNISPRKAAKVGRAVAQDVMLSIKSIMNTDLVILDPPYSFVHYSRFYHVLETVCRGTCGEVFGAGRYPPLSERPASDFSTPSKSYAALSALLQEIANRRATAILTFPAGTCSNGLTGDGVLKLARSFFKVEREVVLGKFSTLGGNGSTRPARHSSEELMLLMHPKSTLVNVHTALNISSSS